MLSYEANRGFQPDAGRNYTCTRPPSGPWLRGLPGAVDCASFGLVAGSMGWSCAGVLDVCARVAPLRSVGAKSLPRPYYYNCGCHGTFKKPPGALVRDLNSAKDTRINKWGWRLRNYSPEDYAKAQAADDSDKSRMPKTGAERKALLEKAAADEAAKAAPTEKTAGK